jgi:hypothetical protein
VRINNADPRPCTLRCETDFIDVSTFTNVVRDPKWSFVDAAGHFHAWDVDGKTPTLVVRQVQMPCDTECDHPNLRVDDEDYDSDELVDCDGWVKTEQRCGLCNELVQRGWRDLGCGRRAVPGRSMWTVEARVADPYSFDHGRVSLVVDAGAGTYFGFGQRNATLVDVGMDVDPHSDASWLALFLCWPFAQRPKELKA